MTHDSIKLNDAQKTILEIMDKEPNKEWRGLELIRKSEQLKDELSGKPLKRGTIYVWLKDLQDKQMVGSRIDESSDPELPLRLYKPTGSGLKKYRLQKATASQTKSNEDWSPGDGGAQPA